MTKGQRTVTSLLAVVAALLLLDLGIRMTSTAQAQGSPFTPRVVGMSVQGQGPRVWRIWSDGLVEQRRVTFGLSTDEFCWQPSMPEWSEVTEECP